MMPKLLRSLAFILLLLGLLGAGVLATETRSLFFWPSALCVAASSFLVLFAGPWRMESSPSQVAMASVLIAGVYFLARAWFSPVWSYAREDLLLMACAINAYVLSATVFSQRQCRTAFLWTLGVLLFGNMVMSVVQFDGHWRFHILEGYERNFGDGKRVGGFYNNSNHLGSFLLFGLFVLGSAAIFMKVKLWSRLLLFLLALLSVLTLALTGSRGAILGSLGGLLVWGGMVLFLVKRAYPMHFWKVLGIGGGILVLGFLCILSPAMDLIQDRVRAGGAQHVLEGDPRTEIWKAALAQWQTSPLIGAGSRMFQDGCIEFRTPTFYGVKEAVFVHNEWIQALAEYGIVGLLLWVVVVVVHLYGAAGYLHWFSEERFLRVANLQGTHLPFALGAVSALVALGLHLLVEFSLHIPSIVLMSAILLGALANPGKIAARSMPRSVPGMRWMTRGVLILGGGVICWCASLHMRADWHYERSTSLNSRKSTDQIDKLLILNEVIEMDPTQFQAFKDRADLRYLMARQMPREIAASFLLQAERDAYQAIALNPKHFYSYLLVAKILDTQRKFEPSYAALEEAYRLAPLYESPRLGFGRHFESQSRWHDAELAYLWASEAHGMGSFLWPQYYDTLLRYLGTYVDRRLERTSRKP